MFKVWLVSTTFISGTFGVWTSDVFTLKLNLATPGT